MDHFVFRNLSPPIYLEHALLFCLERIMKNKIFALSIILILTLILGALLNIKTTTKQGINYHVTEVELPLYLKLLNFYDRHFNYKWLAEHITKNRAHN